VAPSDNEVREAAMLSNDVEASKQAIQDAEPEAKALNRSFHSRSANACRALLALGFRSKVFLYIWIASCFLPS
jgi:hypothetical protein